MADGSVRIKIDADDKAAQKRLDALNRSIEKLKANINKNETAKNAITAQIEQSETALRTLESEISRLKSVLAGTTDAGRRKDISAQIKELEREAAAQSRVTNTLRDRQDKITEKIKEQNALLSEQETEAGTLTRRMSLGGDAERIRAAINGANVSLKAGLKNILKWGFGIRSVFILVRRLRTAIVDAVKSYAEQDEETKASINSLKSSLATLKASWGAAFAPILNAVTPILNTLIDWLTRAANAIQMFFAVLNGKTTFKKAVTGSAALENNLSSAAGAAKDVRKELLGIDELNVMSGNSGSGGGGSSGVDWLEETIDGNSFASRVALSIKDVLFDWSDLTPEQIAEKCFAAATTLGGAILGGAVGGVPGLIIGGLVGLALGIVSDAILFDHDSALSKNEIYGLVRTALLGMGFGAIGLVVGGPLGAALGATIGVGLSLVLDNVTPTSKYGGAGRSGKSTWDWFVLDVLGLPSDREWAEIGKGIVDSLKEGIREKWGDLISDISEKFQNLISKAQELVDNLKQAFNFNWQLPHINLPHLTVTWEPAGALAQFLGISRIPHFGIQWYAKGGIVDGATLIGAGENGKEAIIPLERNTEWISLVAREMSERLSEFLLDTLPALPAVAGGMVIPPSAGGTSFDGLEQKLAELLARLDNGIVTPIEINTTVELDRRVLGESVTRYQAERARALG